MATDKYSEKYGQLSGADLEILGAREQAATARALRTAFKPAQGQMVGGWYVRPSITQNLADALMQYNNYKDEKAGTAKAQELIDARKAATKANALTQAGLSTNEAQPAYDREVTPASTVLVNPEDQATTREPQKFFTGEPAPTPMGAQAVVPPETTANGNINANPTSNRYTTHLPTDAQELTASDNVPAALLGNAVRNAPLDNSAPDAALAADINSPTPNLAGGTPPSPQIPDKTLQTSDVAAPREAPANNEATARILRGENPFDARPARVENIAAVTERMPAVKGYNEGEWLAHQQNLIANDQFHAADAVGAYIKERKVAETARSVAQMSDLKVQREGILNREQARSIATERIEDNATRERQRAEDHKAAAASLQAFRLDIQKISDDTTRRGQDMNAEVRREIAANKPEKQLTEYQGKSLAYGLRSQDANDVLEKIGTEYSPLALDAYMKVEGVPGVGTGAYALLSANDKQVSQAQRNFINAVLRQESGAVINPSEFVNAKKQYFPQPGDDAATLQQKSDNRKRVISSFKTSAGRTVEGEFARPTPSAAPSAPVYIFNKATNKTMVSTDGEKTWKEVK